MLNELNEARLLNAADWNRAVAEIRELANKCVQLEMMLATFKPGTEGAGGSPWFYARITDSAAVNATTDPNRFTYSWTEVAKTVAGYGASAWTAKTGGRTGVKTAATAARNTIEAYNATTGTLGNGVAIANLSGTFKIKPAPANAVVQMFPVTVAGATEYWFTYENAIDGAC